MSRQSYNPIKYFDIPVSKLVLLDMFEIYNDIFSFITTEHKNEDCTLSHTMYQTLVENQVFPKPQE